MPATARKPRRPMSVPSKLDLRSALATANAEIRRLTRENEGYAETKRALARISLEHEVLWDAVSTVALRACAFKEPSSNCNCSSCFAKRWRDYITDDLRKRKPEDQ
jgi:hypothetical protein